MNAMVRRQSRLGIAALLAVLLSSAPAARAGKAGRARDGLDAASQVGTTQAVRDARAALAQEMADVGPRLEKFQHDVEAFDPKTGNQADILSKLGGVVY